MMWKDIIDWETYYEINTNGDVRNKITGHILTGDRNSCGYKRVTLYNKEHDPSHQRFFIHRLVARHFVENPYNLPEVNHKDGNIENNSFKNLEWVTRKENELHSHKYGKKKYKPFTVIFKNGEVKLYDSVPSLSSQIGITPHAVRCWLDHINRGYINRGIKDIYYIANLKV